MQAIRSADIQKIFQHSSLCAPSSLGLSWRGFAVERCRSVPGEHKEEVMTQHFLIVWEDQPLLGERAETRGRFARIAKYPGMISLGPCGRMAAMRAFTESSATVCTLAPSFVESIEAELDHRPAGEMHSHNGVEDNQLQHLARMLASEAEQGGPHGALYSDALIRAFAIRFAFVARAQRQPLGPTSDSHRRGGLTRTQLNRVRARMQDDLQEGVSIAELATLAGLSVSHFSRAFKASTGVAPYSWLLNAKIHKAQQLLRCSNKTCAEIATELGFSDQSHFTRMFRRYTGATPRAWLRDQR